MYFVYRMGTSIKNALAAGAQKKVAPERKLSSASEMKAVKKKGDDEKIAVMIKWTIGVNFIVLAYLILDIKRSIGLYRHVTEPFCDPKQLFVRLNSVIQLLSTSSVTYIFPVKKPDAKTGKTGMMGTTVQRSSSGVSGPRG
jgi:hypothetical protein